MKSLTRRIQLVLLLTVTGVVLGGYCAEAGSCKAEGALCSKSRQCCEGVCVATGGAKRATCQTTPEGSCFNPAPMFAGLVVPEGGIETTILGDSSAIPLDLVRPECQVEDAAEYVYRFIVLNKQGFDIRMLAASGDPSRLNTLLAVQRNCNERLAAVGTCSDDATPPGGLGSRISGTLEPGEYVIIVTGHSAQDLGAYQLQVKFNGVACAPQCDGNECGLDGCGGLCGTCDAPNVCINDHCVDPTSP